MIRMNTSFNIAESGAGSYRMLAILRWVMVVIFVSFGMQKFTLQSAQGIVQFIGNSPFVWWLSVFGLRGEAYFLGVAELGIAALLVAGAFSPLLSAIGSLMGMVTFALTWSFFFTTPGVVKWSWSTDPMAWNLAGEFIYKDIVLLCVCAVLFLCRHPSSARARMLSSHGGNVLARNRRGDCERAVSYGDFGNFGSTISCASQNIPIAFGQRSQITIFEKTHRSQGKRGIFAVHFGKCTERLFERNSRGQHHRYVSVIFCFGPVQNCLELRGQKIFRRGHENRSILGPKRFVDPADGEATEK